MINFIQTFYNGSIISINRQCFPTEELTDNNIQSVNKILSLHKEQIIKQILFLISRYNSFFYSTMKSIIDQEFKNESQNQYSALKNSKVNVDLITKLINSSKYHYLCQNIGYREAMFKGQNSYEFKDGFLAFMNVLIEILQRVTEFQQKTKAENHQEEKLKNKRSVVDIEKLLPSYAFRALLEDLPMSSIVDIINFINDDQQKNSSFLIRLLDISSFDSTQALFSELNSKLFDYIKKRISDSRSLQERRTVIEESFTMITNVKKLSQCLLYSLQNDYTRAVTVAILDNSMD